MNRKFGFLAICILSLWTGGFTISVSPFETEPPVWLAIVPAGYSPVAAEKSKPLLLPQGGQEVLRVYGKNLVSGKWVDVTDQVTWSSRDQSIAVVYDKKPCKGYVRAISKGATRIDVGFLDLVETVEVTVMEPMLAAIKIHPFNAVISSGESKKYEAVAIYTDNSIKDISSEVVWNTSDNRLATVNETGKITSFRPGTVTISAGIGKFSDRVTLEIRGRSLEKILITPLKAAVPHGAIMKFKAEGVYSDGEVRDITAKIRWVSTNEDVASVDNWGLVVAKAIGRTSIHALMDHSAIRSNKIDLVIIETPASAGECVIQINPLNMGDIVPHKTEGWIEDESKSEISGGVLWERADKSIAYIRNYDETPTIRTSAAIVGANPEPITGLANLFVK